MTPRFLGRSLRAALMIGAVVVLIAGIVSPGNSRAAATTEAAVGGEKLSRHLELTQEDKAGAPTQLSVEPTELQLQVGDSAKLKATVTDADNNVVETPVIFLSMARRSVGVTQEGVVEAAKPGETTILVRVPEDPGGDRRSPALLETRVTVRVAAPAIDSIAFVDPPAHFYKGTGIRLETSTIDSTGAVAIGTTGAQPGTEAPRFSSSNARVAQIDASGRLNLMATGRAEIEASAGTATATLAIDVQPNPTTSLSLEASATSARTGDVLHFQATARDASGAAIPEMPVIYAFHARTVEHELGEPSSGLISEDGRFVADLPGEYTIIALGGGRSASRVVAIEPRNVQREIELLGQGRVSDRFTSDLWVWEGTDGRDYAMTGTWGAAGHAYIWDVTDPGNMVVIDMVQVDARTVNDVKVSEDGRVAVISREGASNRRNGIVILDVSDPQAGVKILSRFDDQLTGGVHNIFVYDNHVYALSAGRRYDIINIEDPSNPHRVGRFELDTPAHGIHDVWVQDGIAYSSNWTDGVVAVDVGGGGKGGSPRSPVMLGSYAYPSGWNHAAYPYRSKSTGKFYVFAGDEAGRRGGTPEYDGEPERFDGWIHIIEWDDWGTPREVARYQVPEAGSHNLWVEDDILYIAYYQGGLRVVDVSGELMGDLYSQGREIAYFMTFDPEGFVPNAPMVWGAQPYKGNIFLADDYSGLWAVRLKPQEAALAGSR